jgi:DeoR/GlpR family transcriptional regulator of sugar metabolism
LIDDPEPGRALGMPAPMRRRDMLQLIERGHGATVGQLARYYGVATVTVHRDLEALAQEGAIERVRGGARAVSPQPPVQSDFARRHRSSRAAKERIARRAARLVSEGMTVFLDSSTTCLAVAAELARAEPAPGITVVTNSPAIAYELKAPTMHIIVTPGEVDQDLMLIGGRWTVEFVRRIQFELAFISGAGLTLDHGLATRQRNIADVLHAVRDVARRTVALVDSSKFGVSSLLSIAPATELDEIIVDDNLPADILTAYSRAGVSLTIAGGENLRGSALDGLELDADPVSAQEPAPGAFG